MSDGDTDSDCPSAKKILELRIAELDMVAAIMAIAGMQIDEARETLE